MTPYRKYQYYSVVSHLYRKKDLYKKFDSLLYCHKYRLIKDSSFGGLLSSSQGYYISSLDGSSAIVDRSVRT